MLLKSFLFMINFEMLCTTFVGDQGDAFTKTAKSKRTWTWTTPRSHKAATASDFHGYLQYHYDDETTKRFRVPPLEEIEFEPVVNPVQDHRLVVTPGINCDDFTRYAINCTVESAILYNSTRSSPPMPAKMYDWCSAIRHLTNCAIDWNSDCKDASESHFNEESIKGHMHVVNHICDDDWFLSHYDEVPLCIDKVTDAWEKCYRAFKSVVDTEKNSTNEWTHFLTHFHLCCARTRFRHCTLDVLFLEKETKCPHEQAVILQKYSVIVSEGDVFQDCEKNMMFSSCPHGDPRPPSALLSKLMNSEIAEQMTLDSASSKKSSTLEGLNVVLVIGVCFIKLCL